ncbi:MAG: alkaline phosphatase family protein [Actinobacteria bacterium]|nr:MAG: alkaline phosphatase family protein [Actinomycetota bacterium]
MCGSFSPAAGARARSTRACGSSDEGRNETVRAPDRKALSQRPPKKLVLVVIDALKPAMLERAIAVGRAPSLAQVMERGVYVDDCVAAFPSVTPVCAATITTGVGPDGHWIPSMNWYHREEARYVEYGSSFSASRQFGVLRSLTDTVYRMNAEHLSPHVNTVFETLDDAGVRTAGTTYLIYRGRHEHEVSNETALARIVTSTLFRRTIEGPLELFYADLYASRKTGCRGQLGMPGIRDQHTGCVGAYLVEHDLFDFLLFSLPDNDAWSHKHGPHAQVTSLAAADRQLERLMHAAGGPDAFFEGHAVIVTSDHSQAAVEERIRLDTAFADFDVATQSQSRSSGGEARVISARGELRFTRGGDLQDPRGERWSVEGELAALAAEVNDGQFISTAYPDALERIWSALHCPTAGDVQLSASPGYEFVDWGGADHVGGGSHGSLHATDSLGALLWSGTGPESREAREQWSLRDVAGMVREHFVTDD